MDLRMQSKLRVSAHSFVEYPVISAHQKRIRIVIYLMLIWQLKN